MSGVFSFVVFERLDPARAGRSPQSTVAHGFEAGLRRGHDPGVLHLGTMCGPLRNLPLVALIWALSASAATAPPSRTVDLAGAWRLSSGDETTWAQPDFDDSAWRLVVLPAEHGQLGEAQTRGQALWFRRTVELRRLARSGEKLAIALGASRYGSYELFAGGEKIGGFSGPTLGLPEPPPQVFELPESTIEPWGAVTLALRYVPMEHRAGHADTEPASGPWQLGLHSRLQTDTELERLRDLRADVLAPILAALLFVLGCYELYLYSRRRDHSEHLWFGLFSILVAVNALVDSHWIYELTEDFNLIGRLADGSVHLATAVGLQFVWLFFGRPMRPLLRAYQLSFLALTAFVLLAPDPSWIPRTTAVRWLWQLPAVVLAAGLLMQEIREGNREARTIAFGGSAAILGFGAEIVWQISGRGTLAPLGAVALAVCIVSMELALSNRFSRRFLESYELRQQLEHMVEDRTSELRRVNEQLRTENSERRAAEEAMRMLEQAVEQSSDGIAVIDMTGHLQFLNQAWARMHGYEVFDVLGHHLSLFHSNEQMREQVIPFIERIKSVGAADGEVWHRRSDGELFPTWMSVTLLREPEGGAMGFVCIARDVTERKKAEEEQEKLEARLQQAHKLESLAVLASGIAHDYNNLLTSILGNAELAFEHLTIESPAGRHLRQIEGVAERAAELTERLLSFAGEEQLHIERLELNHLIETMRPELEALVAKKAVLELYLKEGLPPVEIDRVQIRELLSHLVKNAYEALQESESFICVRTGLREVDASYLAGSVLTLDQPEGSCVFLEVADPGPGMDPATQARMFDPFFSTKERERGLGLATVLGIVRAHHGAIKVYSAPGEGTTIEVLFPTAEAASEARDVESPDLDRWLSKGKLMVVDDEQIIRDVSRAILEPHGFTVLTACDGVEAIELYRQHLGEIRAVLLDLTMPRMGGEQALREIRKLDPRARVILMSGYKQRESIRELTESGEASFLSKPFRPADLVGKVHQCLG